jgi:hypothetical protein
VAIEAEPAGDGSYDAPGGVTVFKATDNNWKCCDCITGKFVSLDVFDGREGELRAKGVHMPFTLMPEDATTASQDLEPEYITYSKDGMTAFVSLQEASTLAVLDLESMEWTRLMPLGMKSLEIFAHDVSDKDSATVVDAKLLGNFQTFKGVYEMFQVTPHVTPATPL